MSSRKRSKREKSRRDEPSTRSSEKSENRGITKTPNACKFPNRTYFCEDEFSDDNDSRFIKGTPLNREGQKCVERCPTLLQMHGGWLFPERKYEVLPGQVYDEERENEETEEPESKKIKKPSIRDNQRRPCCCCCMRRQMLCCGCPFFQRSCFMRQMIPYGRMDMNQFQSTGRRGKKPQMEQYSPPNTNQAGQSTIREDKDCDAEFRCTKDMNLASARVNKADEGFKKAVQKEEGDKPIFKSKRSRKSKK